MFDKASLNRAVGVTVGEEPLAEVFAQPPLQFWLSPGGPRNWSQPVEQATSPRFTFLHKDAGLAAIQQVSSRPCLRSQQLLQTEWSANGNLSGGGGGSECAHAAARLPRFPSSSVMGPAFTVPVLPWATALPIPAAASDGFHWMAVW